jgi:hypothetical protein
MPRPHHCSLIKEVSSAKAVRKRGCSAKGGERLGRRGKGQSISSLADKTFYLFSPPVFLSFLQEL